MVARTWAKIRREVVAWQMFVRLEEFQAGVVEVKMQGCWCCCGDGLWELLVVVVVVVEEAVGREG